MAKRCSAGSWVYNMAAQCVEQIHKFGTCQHIDSFKSYINRCDHPKKMCREKRGDLGEFITFRWGPGKGDWNGVARLGEDDVREAKSWVIQAWDRYRGVSASEWSSKMMSESRCYQWPLHERVPGYCWDWSRLRR